MIDNTSAYIAVCRKADHAVLSSGASPADGEGPGTVTL